jgi:two-component system sensor histidine kinase/response regulator
MNDHISKPIDPAAFFETVGRFYKPASSVSRGEPPAKDDRVEGPAVAVEDLPSIAALNTKDGLARVAGNQKLYLKLLGQFAEQQGPVVGQISTALAQGDTALAERLAHTLKGVAGNIGANSVQVAAGALEKLIRNRAAAPEVETAKLQLDEVLSPLVAKLASAFATSPKLGVPAAALPPPVRVDPAQVRAAAAELIKLLSEFDPSAAEFVEANRDALRSLLGDESWPAFEKLVQNYGFAEAQSRLEQAMTSQL